MNLLLLLLLLSLLLNVSCCCCCCFAGPAAALAAQCELLCSGSLLQGLPYASCVTSASSRAESPRSRLCHSLCSLQPWSLISYLAPARDIPDASLYPLTPCDTPEDDRAPYGWRAIRPVEQESSSQQLPAPRLSSRPCCRALPGPSLSWARLGPPGSLQLKLQVAMLDLRTPLPLSCQPQSLRKGDTSKRSQPVGPASLLEQQRTPRQQLGSRGRDSA